MLIYENIILQKCCTDDLKKGGLSNKKVNGHTFVYVERYEIESHFTSTDPHTNINSW